MKYLKYILPLVFVLLIGGVAYASTIPQAPTLFETYLANSQGSTDTTATLSSVALRDGSSLSGYTCITVDANTPSLEYECGILTGTTLAITIRGIDAVTGFTNIPALQFAHHRGADVKITDYPVLTQLANIFQGIDSIATPLNYSSTISTSTIATSRSNIASVGLLDDTAFSGAGVINATTAAKGVLQVSTALQAASSTPLGSSGASLALPSSIATSTYNAATAPLKVVVTTNAGTIDPNFINLANYTGSITLASTTVVGSTQILAIGKNEFASTTPGTGTWTVPSGITKVYVRIVGGGGSGGLGSECGSGGGAAGYAEGILSVSGTLSFTLGSGGAGVSSSGPGITGGNSTVGGLTANGGAAGSVTGTTNVPIAGGPGGSASGGTFSSTGATGSFCIGETGGIINGVLTASVLGGSSGSGGTGAGSGTSGAGGPGAIIISY